MAAETVKFFVIDQNSDPILGVLVRIFDITGTTFITQDTTVDVGGDAVAEVTLDGDDPPIQYTIRVSKTGVAFDGSLGDISKSPQSIDVWTPPANSPTGKNDFDLKGETFTRPVATDPRLCRCSGFFKDGAGRPLANLDLYFVNQFRPAIVDDNAVLGEKLQGRTDADGYFETDLYRGGIYEVYIQSVQAATADDGGAFTRELHVPDQSSANLVTLLFPIVGEVEWTPASVSVAVDATLDLVPLVKGTDGRELTGTALEDVEYEVADTDIATISVEADKIVVTGKSAGSTELTVTRKDQTIVVIPDPGITGSPLAITVT
jgi:hypothetical protein